MNKMDSNDTQAHELHGLTEKELRIVEEATK